MAEFSGSLQLVKQTNDPTVVEVFDFWVSVMHSKPGRRGPKPVLSPKRQRKIVQALRDYGLESCKEAILGCSLSPFHMGKNIQGRVWNDIELILRDASKIEQFIDIYHGQKTGGGFLDED